MPRLTRTSQTAATTSDTSASTTDTDQDSGQQRSFESDLKRVKRQQTQTRSPTSQSQSSRDDTGGESPSRATDAGTTAPTGGGRSQPKADQLAAASPSGSSEQSTPVETMSQAERTASKASQLQPGQVSETSMDAATAGQTDGQTGLAAGGRDGQDGQAGRTGRKAGRLTSTTPAVQQEQPDLEQDASEQPGPTPSRQAQTAMAAERLTETSPTHSQPDETDQSQFPDQQGLEVYGQTGSREREVARQLEQQAIENNPNIDAHWQVAVVERDGRLVAVPTEAGADAIVASRLDAQTDRSIDFTDVEVTPGGVELSEQAQRRIARSRRQRARQFGISFLEDKNLTLEAVEDDRDPSTVGPSALEEAAARGALGEPPESAAGRTTGSESTLRAALQRGALGDPVGAAVEQQLETQLEEQTGADLEAGTDFTVQRTGSGVTAQLTDTGRERVRQAQQEPSVIDVPFVDEGVSMTFMPVFGTRVDVGVPDEIEVGTKRDLGEQSEITVGGVTVNRIPDRVDAPLGVSVDVPETVMGVPFGGAELEEAGSAAARGTIEASEGLAAAVESRDLEDSALEGWLEAEVDPVALRDETERSRAESQANLVRAGGALASTPFGVAASTEELAETGIGVAEGEVSPGAVGTQAGVLGVEAGATALENPEMTALTLGLSAGVFAGARAISPRLGRATAWTIQPGEELASAGLTRAFPSVARRFPNNKIDNEEIIIRGAVRGTQKTAAVTRGGLEKTATGARVAGASVRHGSSRLPSVSIELRPLRGPVAIDPEFTASRSGSFDPAAMRTSAKLGVRRRLPDVDLDEAHQKAIGRVAGASLDAQAAGRRLTQPVRDTASRLPTTRTQLEDAGARVHGRLQRDLRDYRADVRASLLAGKTRLAEVRDIDVGGRLTSPLEQRGIPATRTQLEDAAFRTRQRFGQSYRDFRAGVRARMLAGRGRLEELEARGQAGLDSLRDVDPTGRITAGIEDLSTAVARRGQQYHQQLDASLDAAASRARAARARTRTGIESLQDIEVDVSPRESLGDLRVRSQDRLRSLKDFDVDVAVDGRIEAFQQAVRGRASRLETRLRAPVEAGRNRLDDAHTRLEAAGETAEGIVFGGALTAEARLRSARTGIEQRLEQAGGLNPGRVRHATLVIGDPPKFELVDDELPDGATIDVEATGEDVAGPPVDLTDVEVDLDESATGGAADRVGTRPGRRTGTAVEVERQPQAVAIEREQGSQADLDAATETELETEQQPSIDVGRVEAADPARETGRAEPATVPLEDQATGQSAGLDIGGEPGLRTEAPTDVELDTEVDTELEQELEQEAETEFEFETEQELESELEQEQELEQELVQEARREVEAFGGDEPRRQREDPWPGPLETSRREFEAPVADPGTIARSELDDPLEAIDARGDRRDLEGDSARPGRVDVDSVDASSLEAGLEVDLDEAASLAEVDLDSVFDDL